MIRLKLIGIGVALLAIIMLACSCVANVETQNQSKDFDVKSVYSDGYGIVIYEVTTPKGSVYIARYGQGLCKLM
jgi:hypothetical protein